MSGLARICHNCLSYCPDTDRIGWCWKRGPYEKPWHTRRTDTCADFDSVEPFLVPAKKRKGQEGNE